MYLIPKICFLFLTFLLPLANGEKFEGDSCQMKSVNGVCKLASQCPELETAVRAGMFSTRDIVNCGYTTREEIICCPTGERVTTEIRQTDTTTTTTTTTAPTSTDFWSHLLTPEMTTTPQPDFWLHLLNSTTTASLTTTTPTTLIVNGKQLDPDSEFIDLSDLLSQNGRRQKNNAIPTSNIEPVQNEPIKLRPVPDSINDRTFGWQTPAINQPQPRPAPWNAGSTNGMPFRDDRRNSRRDRLTWQSAEQPNFIWPNQQESNIQRPTSNWPTPQPHRFSNQISHTAADGFQEPSRRNERTQPPPQWQNGNEFVENFRPSNNGARNENMFQRSPPSNSLPNRPIWPAENNQQKHSNSFTDPIAFVNDNLMKNGMNIIKAKASEVDRFNKWQFDASSSAELTTTSTTTTTTTSTTTQRARVSDIFAPFQFRPQPDADYDDDNEISKNVRPSHRGSSDFRFPGEAEIRPAWNFDQSKNTATTPTPVKSSTTISSRTNDRPAIVACREIESGRDPSLSFHVLDGTPVELKEFPHMAAIGYRSIGNDDGPYDYRCGGTLIAKRFVLTAAHCVNSRESQPAVVLLGLVNMNEPDERQFSEEIKIRRVHIHDDYSSSRTYHDVAVLELEREVTYTEYIYPTCLYTELTDPPPPFQKQVYVSGWGRIRTGSREKSGILLKAKLEVVPVSQCNASYVEMGLNRRIDVGVMNSQMCAHDPGLTKDACEGDSGGPLLMVEDEAFRKYKVIGIISAGFSCGSATPGLYARVGAYLDYIESIVWPNTAG